jgi:glycosyltransferase involved in cell wall biosynthesis
MNIMCLAQVFELGHEPGSDRHFFICRHLVRSGHTVTAITSNVDYKRAVVKYPSAGWRVHRRIDGVDIQYVYSFAGFRGSLLKRAWYYLTYFFVSLVAGLRSPQPNVIYAVSTPLTTGLLGYLISRLRGASFVFEVTDVWPDAAVAVGVVKNPVLLRLARWMELFCYRKAVCIIALTEGIQANIIGKGVPRDKVILNTNGIDPQLFEVTPSVKAKGQDLRREWGLHDRFVCLYLGAHGAYNALWTAMDAAEALKEDSRFVFVLVGDGDAKEALQDMVEERGLTNVRFLPPVPRQETPGLLQAADAFVLPNRRGDFFAMNLPNKLFDFLASGRPVVVAGRGESATVVERSGAGRVVGAEDGKGMAKALAELAILDEAERTAMGEAGRRHVLTHFDRSALNQGVLEAFERTRSGQKPAGRERGSHDE